MQFSEMSVNSFEKKCLEISSGAEAFVILTENDPHIRKMTSYLETKEPISDPDLEERTVWGVGFSDPNRNNCSFPDSAASKEGFSPFEPAERKWALRNWYFLNLLGMEWRRRNIRLRDLCKYFISGDICSTRGTDLANSFEKKAEKLSLIEILNLLLMYVSVRLWNELGANSVKLIANEQEYCDDDWKGWDSIEAILSGLLDKFSQQQTLL